MAYICNKPAGSCKTCENYRFDENRERMACFAKEEKKELTREEIIDIAFDLTKKMISAKTKEEKREVIQSLDKYDDKNKKMIYIAAKEIIAEISVENHCDVPDCRKCIFCYQHSFTHHIACLNSFATVRGDKHGEKNGWFQYPINFDPIWLNYCDGFKEKE